MDDSEKLKKVLNDKERKLRKLERLTEEIESVKGDITALRRSLAIIGYPVSAPSESENSNSPEKLKRGEGPAQTEKLLREMGEPLYIDDIVTALHARGVAVNKPSLIGTLSRRVNKQDTFTRLLDKPNTYGLLAWENQEGPEDNASEANRGFQSNGASRVPSESIEDVV